MPWRDGDVSGRMDNPQDELYEFGPFRIDPALCRLLRGATHVPLPPKAFDLLLILARNPNRVLPKGELIQALWPDTFVDDGNLTQHMFTLRKALGGEYIETVARRGYVFSAAVRRTSSDAPPAASPVPAPPLVVDAERKQVTVMSCGVSNAGWLAERFGPAQLDALMTELIALAAEEVGRYEGVVRRTGPDALEAVFGAR